MVNKFFRKRWWVFIPAGLCLAIAGFLLVGKYTGWFNNLAAGYLEAGRRAEESRLYGQALSHYQIVLAFRELDGESAYRAQCQIAAVYEAKRRYNESIDALKSAIGTRPGEAAGRLQLGNLYLKTGAIAQAQEQFESVLSRDSAHSAALLGLARTFIAEGEAAASVRKYLLRAEQGEAAIAAQYYLGLLALKHESDLPRAREIFTELSAKEGAEDYASQSRMLLSGISSQDQELSAWQSEFAKREVDVETTPVLEQDAVRAYRAVRRAWMFIGVSEFKLAEEEALAAREKIADYRDAHLVTAYLKLIQGNFTAATAVADEALSTDPLSAYGYALYGQAALGAGQDDSARAALFQARELGQDTVGVALSLARLAQKKDDKAAAKAEYDRALQLDQYQTVGLVQEIVWFYLYKLNTAPEAVQLMRQATASGTVTARLLSLKALAEVAAGDLSAAAEDVRGAQNFDPREALAEYVLAKISESRGNNGEAEAHYRLAVEYDLTGEVAALIS